MGTDPGARQSGRFAVEGGSLAWQVVGDGPPVVLVHGFALDRRMWDDIAPGLAHDHTVITYDCRGFGESAEFDHATAYTHSEDLLALLAHLGLERAALVGLSFGGGVVLKTALRAPDAGDTPRARRCGPWRRAVGRRDVARQRGCRPCRPQRWGGGRTCRVVRTLLVRPGERAPRAGGTSRRDGRRRIPAITGSAPTRTDRNPECARSTCSTRSPCRQQSSSVTATCRALSKWPPC